LRGLEAAMNIHNLTLGFSVFFLSRILGNLYFINNIDHEIITRRAIKSLLINTVFFLPAFLSFLIMLMLKKGFAVDPDTGTVFYGEFKYMMNLVQMPLVGILFLTGIILVLYGVIKTLTRAEYTKGIWLTGPGTIMTVFSLFLIAGYNNTAFYPSTYNLQSSLTIANSSSSRFTLVTMSYASLFVPFVIAYIAYTWRAMNSQKINSAEVESNSHVY
jgi:cytochrome d ubiquinol oxidase subunit II